MHSSMPASPARWVLQPEQVLPTWQIIAENDATDSANPMHDDATARQLGFAGGLVPGVTLYGYLTHPLIALFGEAFLHQGSFEARFRRPVYTGETLTTYVRVSACNNATYTFELALKNAAGEACVVGSASFPSHVRELPTLTNSVPLPAVRRPATPEALGSNPQLGTLHEIFTPAQNAALLRGMGEDLALYQSVVHPAWLLRQANMVVDSNVAVGPWIHVASKIEHFGVVPLNEPYTVHARVAGLSVHKNHDYADFEVTIATTQVVMWVMHRAIYRMGAALHA